MMLRYAKDQEIRDNPPEVRTGKKWIAEEEVERAMGNLMHRDNVGAVQNDRKGLGMQSFKPFYQSSANERRDSVVNEVKRCERERRHVHLVQCSRQGQCVRWEEHVVERKLSWKRVVGMGTGATELPSEVNI